MIHTLLQFDLIQKTIEHQIMTEFGLGHPVQIRSQCAFCGEIQDLSRHHLVIQVSQVEL